MTRCLALAALALATACGPGRTTFATAPGAATTFDPAASDAKAVTVADQVFAAAGGPGNWDKAKQIRWGEAITKDGAVVSSGEQAWDRWNGRHYGRLDLGKNDVVVMRELYGDTGSAYIDTGNQMQKMAEADTANALKTAQERWQFDTAALLLPFLLKAPGTTLKYGGEIKDDAGQPTLEEIKVTFDAKDGTRDGTTYYAVVDKGTHTLVRIEMVKRGQPDTARLGYKVIDWTTVDGLKFPSAIENIGLKGEGVQFKDIKVSSEPDDDLYVPKVQM